jgi:hypothetical protein
MKGDVIEVDETCSGVYKEKRASDGDGEGYYWLARLKTRQSVTHDDPEIYGKCTLD